MASQPTFKLTERQYEAATLLANPSHNRVMLYGGSRSGKTFLAVWAIINRAWSSPNSRHAIIRYRFNAVKRTVGMDTLPKVMSLAFPGVPYKIDRTDWVCRFENGSEIWFLGLDDKERVEKVLGAEFATLYFNEASELSWPAVETALTRLAQNCNKVDGRELRLVALFDCNPPGKAHWTYKHFVLKETPGSREPYAYPDSIAYLQMNPDDNRANLPDQYFDTLAGLSGAARKRFLRGEFADDTDGALWTQETIDASRTDVPDNLRRIVVAVDPSGAGGSEDYRSDEIGIVVAGEGYDGHAYILEDCTLRASPDQWARVAVDAYHRWKADLIVAEKNYGGGMVEAVIRTADRNVPVRMVSATRGKAIRAEPIAGLYEQGKVHHAGTFPQLEDQLCGFLASGYIGDKSPDRADALIWAVSELMLKAGRSRRVKVKFG
jgi:phage terminase large subunit-like protein